MQIGKHAFIDLLAVSAVYIEDGILVIRIGGMGIIKMEGRELYASPRQTVLDILQELKVIK